MPGRKNDYPKGTHQPRHVRRREKIEIAAVIGRVDFIFYEFVLRPSRQAARIKRDGADTPKEDTKRRASISVKSGQIPSGRVARRNGKQIEAKCRPCLRPSFCVYLRQFLPRQTANPPLTLFRLAPVGCGKKNLHATRISGLTIVKKNDHSCQSLATRRACIVE